LEGFYDMKREELPKSASSTTSASSDVFKRLKSMNPRHMRIKTEGGFTEENFRRRKYVDTKKRLQYFSKAIRAAE